MAGKKFPKNLKCGDEVAVAVKDQETVWRKATVKHGVDHGSIVVELAGREIEFTVDGTCAGDPTKGQSDKVLLKITPEMREAVKRTELLLRLGAYEYDLLTTPELEAVLTTLDETTKGRKGESTVTREDVLVRAVNAARENNAKQQQGGT